MAWTRFMDMHSGGGRKLDWEYIYIEAPDAEARVIFYNRFGRNPERVTCTCCGNDYSISESVSLEQATGYDRHCNSLATPRVNGLYRQPDDPWFKAHYYIEPADEAEALRRGWSIDKPVYMRAPCITVEEYAAQPEVLIIRAADIAPSERVGEVPAEGYVWAEGR